jgi:hypothetical protein
VFFDELIKLTQLNVFEINADTRPVELLGINQGVRFLVCHQSDVG